MRWGELVKYVGPYITSVFLILCCINRKKKLNKISLLPLIFSFVSMFMDYYLFVIQQIQNFFICCMHVCTEE